MQRNVVTWCSGESATYQSEKDPNSQHGACRNDELAFRQHAKVVTAEIEIQQVQAVPGTMNEPCTSPVDTRMRHRRKKKEKKKASAYIKLHGHVYMDLRVHSIQGNEATLTLSVFSLLVFALSWLLYYTI